MSLYCKKCGRQLRAEARFCDRCGYVIQKETPKRSSGTSTTRKTASSSRTADRRRNTSKKKSGSGVKVILFLLFAIIIGTVSGMVSYNFMSAETNKSNVQNTMQPEETPTAAPVAEDDEEPEETKAPKATEKAKKSEEKKAETTKKANDFSIADNCSTYDNDRMNGIKCPYPDEFVQSSKGNSNTLISYEDSLNDGYMKICVEEVGSSDTASKLMREYIDGLGAKAEDTDSGDGWYEVSFTRNKKYNHRKAVIVDDACVYYDFSYDVDSEEKSTYDDYIEYFDFFLDEELSDIQSSED